MVVILLAQAFATSVMVGVIWFAQVVHYPLLAEVGQEGFPEYEFDNMRRTGWVVTPPMVVEGLTALTLIWLRPEGVLLVQVWTGLALLGVIWLSTIFLQVPKHNRLARGFDTRAHQALLATNWVRTAAWSARGLVVLWMLSRTVH
jgi:hypothetical protein